MQAFKILGGRKLKGEVKPQGAKNEALQIICATLLTPEEVVINNIYQVQYLVMEQLWVYHLKEIKCC